MSIKNLPKSAQIYIVTVMLLALGLLVHYSWKTHFNSYIWQGLIFFGILAVCSESMKVYLPRGGYITVTLAVLYACVLLFGTAVAAYVIISGIILANLTTREKKPWYKLMFNCGQYIICVVITNYIYVTTGGVTGKIDPLNIGPIIMSAFGFSFVNQTAVTVILALVERISPWRVWITNLKWTLPNYFTLSFISVLMAGIYSRVGYWGVSLLFIPLLLARYVFKSYMEVRQVYLNTLEALASALDAKDAYTRGHSERVAKYAVGIARELKLPEDQIEAIENMALLHDIGKIGVSAELLNREGKLSSGEFDLIKLHPVIGANILKEIHDLGAAPDYIRYHHEKYDGTGYPDRLKGDSIPLGARIITLADSFDAMISGRNYRPKVEIEEALKEVKRSMRTHFDPRLAEVLITSWQGGAGRVKPGLLEVAGLTDKLKAASITDK